MFRPLAAAASSGEAGHSTEQCINNRQAAKLLPLFSPSAQIYVEYEDEEYSLFLCFKTIIKESSETGTDPAITKMQSRHYRTAGAIYEENRSHHQTV
jgi:hypothetical protein